MNAADVYSMFAANKNKYRSHERFLIHLHIFSRLIRKTYNLHFFDVSFRSTMFFDKNVRCAFLPTNHRKTKRFPSVRYFERSQRAVGFKTMFVPTWIVHSNSMVLNVFLIRVIRSD